MRFEPLPLHGAFLVHRDPFPDDRGWFSRAFTSESFGAQGLPTAWAQAAGSFNARAGTLRGLHYQRAPHAEAKLLHCVRGRIYDVMVDLRPGSPTRGQHWATVLEEHDHRMVFVPTGFAHGYQSLTDAAEIFYFMSAAYRPDHQGGLRWDSPALGISWPLAPTELSPRDRTLPLWEP